MSSTKNEEDPRNYLPEELLWADGGHASDIALTAISDGQTSIVPPAVRSHVDRCTACTTHLGHAVLLSLHSGEQLAYRAEHDRALAAANARRPLPRLAIALGLGVAILGLVPSFFDHGEISSVQSFVTRDVPLFLKGLGQLGRHIDEPGNVAGLFVTYLAAALLVAMGIAVARLMPKKETQKS